MGTCPRTCSGRTGTYQTEQIKATIKGQKSPFVAIISTIGRQFGPRLWLLAAKPASSRDDERGTDVRCHYASICSPFMAHLETKDTRANSLTLNTLCLCGIASWVNPPPPNEEVRHVLHIQIQSRRSGSSWELFDLWH